MSNRTSQGFLLTILPLRPTQENYLGYGAVCLKLYRRPGTIDTTPLMRFDPNQDVPVD